MSNNEQFDLPTMNEGRLFVLSAPAGTGKTTLAYKLIEQCSNLTRGVTTTTRKPRVNEKDGVDYHFVSEKQFAQMKADNEFIETVSQYGFQYGTAKKDVEHLLARGQHVLLVIDTDGAKVVSSMWKDAVLIFLKPPSLDELNLRLLKRGSEDAESLARRLHKAHRELQEEKNFRYSLVNDTLDKALFVLKAIVIAECYRIK